MPVCLGFVYRVCALIRVYMGMIRIKNRVKNRDRVMYKFKVFRYRGRVRATFI